jgi:hypothetical protein
MTKNLKFFYYFSFLPKNSHETKSLQFTFGVFKKNDVVIAKAPLCSCTNKTPQVLTRIRKDDELCYCCRNWPQPHPLQATISKAFICTTAKRNNKREGRKVARIAVLANGGGGGEFW